jgi:putative two-component system response regulator
VTDATQAGAGILIVDDTVANLELLSELLRVRGYDPRPVLSGEAAFAAALADPPDLIMLDVDMPEQDGYEVCARFKQHDTLRTIPVIFVSAFFIQASDKVKAFSLGAVDYITKPFQAEEVFARVETHLRLRRLQQTAESYSRGLEGLVREKVEELVDAQMATIFALARLAEHRDDDTGRHLERVGAACRLLGGRLRRSGPTSDALNGEYVENLYHAAPLHDIGKVGIPDAILLKPGKLTVEEFEDMKRHTVLGADTLKEVQTQYPGNAFLKMGIQIAESHHERWDGRGYPVGLSGRDIPLPARILAVADVYDAVRSVRSYKPARTHADAHAVIVEGRGTQFDPWVVDVYAACEPEFEALWASLSTG